MDRPLERPALSRAATRTAVGWDAVERLLGDAAQLVVDIAGGSPVRLAVLGRRVTVVDPSPDALAAAGRRADEQGVADRVTALQGDLTDLLDLVPAGSVDLVLCHGVLGLVDDPAAALRTLGT